jgi:hypothetical protein
MKAVLVISNADCSGGVGNLIILHLDKNTKLTLIDHDPQIEGFEWEHGVKCENKSTGEVTWYNGYDYAIIPLDPAIAPIGDWEDIKFYLEKHT